MRSFDYVAATDVRHAVTLLAEHGADAKVLAGGTDLLVDLKAARHGPRLVIDISRMRALREIALTDEGLRIGTVRRPPRGVPRAGCRPGSASG